MDTAGAAIGPLLASATLAFAGHNPWKRRPHHTHLGHLRGDALPSSGAVAPATATVRVAALCGTSVDERDRLEHH
jgi:hypothetical protein